MTDDKLREILCQLEQSSDDTMHYGRPIAYAARRARIEIDRILSEVDRLQSENSALREDVKRLKDTLRCYVEGTAGQRARAELEEG